TTHTGVSGYRNLNRPHRWSTLTTNLNVSEGSSPARCLIVGAFAPQPVAERNTNARPPKQQESVTVLGSPLVEKPRCQTLKSRVRSATLRSLFPNANRSTTGNETLLIRSAARHVAMRGGRTSVVQGDPAANVNDLK